MQKANFHQSNIQKSRCSVIIKAEKPECEEKHVRWNFTTRHAEKVPTRRISALRFRAAINRLLLLVNALRLYHKRSAIAMNVSLSLVEHILPLLPYLRQQELSNSA